MDQLIDVEYNPVSGYFKTVSKKNQHYCGIVQRSDGITCLAIKQPGSARRHLIEMRDVEAITRRGERIELRTDPNRWRTRAQEIRFVVEGQCEEWALPAIRATPVLQRADDHRFDWWEYIVMALMFPFYLLWAMAKTAK